MPTGSIPTTVLGVGSTMQEGLGGGGDRAGQRANAAMPCVLHIHEWPLLNLRCNIKAV